MADKAKPFLVETRTPADIINLIVQMRRTRRLTQAELAQRAGVSRAWLASVERGKPRIDLGLVLRTLATLGVHLAARADDHGAEKGKAVKAKRHIAPVDIDSIVEAARRRARHE